MKAILKVHISVQLEGESYDLAWAHAGTTNIGDRAEAERFLESLAHNVRSAAAMMSVAPSVGTHVPDLALAKGGDQEGGRCTSCGHGAGYHAPEGAARGVGGVGPCWAPMMNEDGRCTCRAFINLIGVPVQENEREPSLKQIAIRSFSDPVKE